MEWGERTFQGAEIVGMGSAKAGGLKTVRGPVWLMLRDWTRKTVGGWGQGGDSPSRPQKPL